jgi:phosphonatase-like hydrolase
MNIELVVFDLAGTTVDDGDAVNRCLRAALERGGVVVTADQVNAVMGLPKPEAIRRLAGPGRPVEEMFAEFESAMIRFYADDPAVAEFPGTRETFAALRDAGIKVAVNTGFSRTVTAAVLDRMGWTGAGLVDASVTSDEVPRGRPHPDMIRRLTAELGIGDPSRVAKVGDTPVDLEEGANAGCGRIIGVTSGTHTRAQLAAYPHTDLIESVAEIPRLFGIEASH